MKVNISKSKFFAEQKGYLESGKIEYLEYLPVD
jgi:hypothetical protein